MCSPYFKEEFKIKSEIVAECLIFIYIASFLDTKILPSIVYETYCCFYQVILEYLSIHF